MKKNLGRAERIIRATIGLGAICAGVWLGSWWGALGLMPLFTAATGWCGTYAILAALRRKKAD